MCRKSHGSFWLTRRDLGYKNFAGAGQASPTGWLPSIGHGTVQTAGHLLRKRLKRSPFGPVMYYKVNSIRVDFKIVKCVI